ncbi:MAG: response regulator [Desulfobacterales bacterium]|nr:response regulator [Desulfobacterales bacterium]
MDKNIINQPILVLLIEDDKDHAELITRGFKKYLSTTKIVHISDGESALDYLFKRGKYKNVEISMPNLILLDLRLPRVDGLEVLKIIKTSENLRKIPVIILTTSDAETDIAMAYNKYANSYIVKPIDFSKFVQLIQNLGLYWIESNVYHG